MTEENKTDNLPKEPESEDTDRENTPVDNGASEDKQTGEETPSESRDDQEDSGDRYTQTLKSAEETADEIYSGDAESSEGQSEEGDEPVESSAEEFKPPESEPEPEPVSDGFKPYYKGEARKSSVVKIGLFIVMAALAVFLLGMGVDAFLKDLPFKIVSTAIVIICLAIIGVLWKTISLEAKTGLAALGVGLLLALSNTLYSRQGLGAFGLDGVYILAGFHCLVILALLIGIFKIIPKFWVKLVLTVIVLYGALAPVWPFITGPAETPFITGPPFLSGLPSVLGPGWILAQIILPLGALLILYLQGRILLRPQYDTHWGFLFWALCMVLMAATGLSELERVQKPVFPALNQTIGNVFPVVIVEPEPAAPEETPKVLPVAPETGAESTTPHPGPGPADEKTGEAVVAPAPETAAGGEDETSFPKPDESVSEPDQEPMAEKDADVTAPEGTAAEESAETEKTPGAPAPDPTAEAVRPPETATNQSEKIDELTRQIEAMDNRIGELQDRLDSQEKLIRALLDYFGQSPDFDIKPEQHGLPQPPMNEPQPPAVPTPPPIEPAPPIDQPPLPPIDNTSAPTLLQDAV